MRSSFFILASIVCSYLYALPESPHVAHGEAFENISGSNKLIYTSDRAIIDWKSFSIASGEAVHFLQPSPNSAVLNRVTGSESSSLMGLLQANGKVFLINPNGIIIGKDAVIDTAGFIASGFRLLEEGFIAGEELLFEGGSGSIVNYGTVHAWDGDIVLLGVQVDNQGLLEAPNGDVLLGSGGSQILLKPSGSERLFIQIPSENSQEDQLSNSGNIVALTAELKAEGGPYGYAIKHSGKIDALSLESKGGKVFLVANQGKTVVDGAIAAQKQDVGGEVRVLGDNIVLFEHASIDASGERGGGEVLLGGDYQGKNPLIPNSKQVYFDKDAFVDVSAKNAGNAGRVILWSDEATGFYGKINARGGESSGDGGFVEVSSKGFLEFQGFADRAAPMGVAGMLLLDPTDITISAGGNASINFAAGTYTGLANTANIQNTDLQTNWAAGPVTITTVSAFAGNGDITFSAPVSVNTANSLTLIADRDININDSVVNAFTTLGQGAFILQAVRDVNITPAGTATIAELVSGNTLGTGFGSLTITAVNLNVIGGTAPAVPARIFVGPVNATLTGNIQVVGGTGANCFARITGSGSSVYTVTGTTLVSGGATGQQSFLAAAFPPAASLLITGPSSTPAGAVTIQGGTVSNATATILTSGGTLQINTSDLSLLGGTQTGTIATMSSSNGGTLLNVTNTISLNGGTGTASIANIGTVIGSLTINSAAVSLLGGAGSNASATISSNIAGSDITINTTGNVTVGSSSALSGSSISSNNSAINMNLLGNLILDAGANSSATASIQPAANSTINANNIQLTSNTQAAASISPIGGGGNLTMNTLANFTMASSNPANPSTIGIFPSVLLRANQDFIMTEGEIGDSSTVTIVCDNQAPSPPSIGSGSFTLSADSSIGTGAIVELNIYTALFAQNTIEGTNNLNGATFAGVMNVPDPNNQYGFYFPAANFTAPYTIYYKAFLMPGGGGIVIPDTENSFNRANSEQFRNWHLWDRSTASRKAFNVFSSLSVEDSMMVAPSLDRVDNDKEIQWQRKIAF